MKTIYKKLKNRIMILIIVNMSVILCSCYSGGNGTNHEDMNYFGGIGELHNTTYVSKSGLYDDENVYMLCGITLAVHDSYVRINKDNEVYINCDLASCNHSDSTCKAFAEWIFFRFGDELYKYSGRMIKSQKTNDKVFKSNVPKYLQDESVSPEIDGIFVLDENYAIVSSFGYCNLVDKKFNIVYTYTDVGRFRWGKIYEGIFYYVNDIEQLISVDIETGKSEPVSLDDVKIFQPDDDEEYIFFSTENSSLYKYSLLTQEMVKINELPYLMYIVDHGYIYNRAGDKIQKWDYDGNLVFETEQCPNMHPENANIANDKLYSVFRDSEDNKSKIIIMNTDGTGYQECSIEK